jgi:hypothetical protein
MTIRKPIVLLMLVLLCCQTLLAGADFHAAHQTDNNHQQAASADLDHALDVGHHVDQQHTASTIDVADDNCTHCCHCHASSFTFSQLATLAPPIKRLSLLNYSRFYHSITLNTPFRPPAVS